MKSLFSDFWKNDHCVQHYLLYMKLWKLQFFQCLPSLLPNICIQTMVLSTAHSTVRQSRTTLFHAASTFNDTTGKSLKFTCSAIQGAWVLFVFSCVLRFSLTGEGMCWTESFCWLLSCWLRCLPNSDLIEMPTSSAEDAHQTGLPCSSTWHCQPCKAGDRHIEEWLLSTGDPGYKMGLRLSWLSLRAELLKL